MLADLHLDHGFFAQLSFEKINEIQRHARRCAKITIIMNFGAEIDDDFFAESKEKREEAPSDKAGKICHPKWFLEDSAASSTDEEETVKALRYKADYLYYAKRYAEASRTYQQCLEVIPTTNIPASRECMEGLSRSLLRDGNPEKALEWALKMHASADSPDQMFSSWNLLATVCHVLEKYEEELEALHCCIDMHKNDPDFWMRLAYCYSGLFGICLPGSRCKLNTSSKFCCIFKKQTSIPVSAATDESKQNLHLSNPKTDDAVHSFDESSNNDVFNHAIDQPIEKCEICTLATQVITACLLRTRILMAANNNNTSAINRRRLYLTTKRVNACLARMKIDSLFIEEASKLLKSEMYASSETNDELQSHSNGACADSNSELLISKGLQFLKLH